MEYSFHFRVGESSRNFGFRHAPEAACRGFVATIIRGLKRMGPRSGMNREIGMSAPGNMAGMVIVGAGECGARAAFALRENGYQGPVTLVGEEVHLPYERPPLSKEALHRDEEPEPKWIGLAERFAEQGIDCLTGRSAVAIDRADKAVRLSDGSRARLRQTAPGDRRPAAAIADGGECRSALRYLAQLRRCAGHPAAACAGHAACRDRRRLHRARSLRRARSSAVRR